MKKKLLILFSIIFLLMCGCSKDFSNSEISITQTPKPTQAPTQTPSESPKPTPKETQAEKLLSKMTTAQKVAQLFIIRPESFTAGNLYETNQEFSDNFEKYPVGGFILFSQNIKNPEQLSNFTNEINNSCSTPVFMSIDEEGGIVSRIANNSNFDVTKYANMESIGKTGVEAEAFEVGETIANYLKEYGFNWTFAPVCDVNTNPKNIVIGKRAFGSEPELVSKMVTAEIFALQENGVISSAKHFPGHGDTSGDTHNGFVSLNKDLSQLENSELIPFYSAISAGVDSVMVSHISCSDLDPSNLPASLSYEITTKLLKEKMNYNGIIITDGMEMGAIVDNYSSGEAAILAINAGVDIILLPDDFFSAYDSVLNAVEENIISENRLNESVLKILNLKEKYEILT